MGECQQAHERRPGAIKTRTFILAAALFTSHTALAATPAEVCGSVTDPVSRAWCFAETEGASQCSHAGSATFFKESCEAFAKAKSIGTRVCEAMYTADATKNESARDACIAMANRHTSTAVSLAGSSSLERGHKALALAVTRADASECAGSTTCTKAVLGISAWQHRDEGKQRVEVSDRAEGERARVGEADIELPLHPPGVVEGEGEMVEIYMDEGKRSLTWESDARFLASTASDPLLASSVRFQQDTEGLSPSDDCLPLLETYFDGPSHLTRSFGVSSATVSGLQTLFGANDLACGTDLGGGNTVGTLVAGWRATNRRLLERTYDDFAS